MKCYEDGKLTSL